MQKFKEKTRWKNGETKRRENREMERQGVFDRQYGYVEKMERFRNREMGKR